MNLIGKFTIRHPSSTQLQIKREPGAFFWLFTLFFSSFAVVINLLFALMFLDVQLPSTLTCRSQQQRIICEHITTGPLSGKTTQVQDVRSAILSQQPNGETIVLTSSQPWVVLQSTDQTAQDVERINQTLAQLRQRDQTVQIQLQPPVGMSLGIIVFFGPLGLLFLSLSLALLLGEGPASFEFDAERNSITVTKLGLWRSRLARFSNLTAADRKPAGYLGRLSEWVGVYLGNSDTRQWGQEIVRLLFDHRRPIHLIKTERFGQAAEIVDSINAFIAEQRK